jgi:YHS domain-containing protein
MVRVVLYLFLAIILISLIRSVIGIIGKAISSAADADAVTGRARTSAGGDLKRDPVCGTYVSAASSIKMNVGKDVLHFCSPACRDKYHKAS